MYDISKLDIGEKFYWVPDIYKFIECEIIDRNVYYFEIIKRNVLRYKNSFSALDMGREWIKADIRKDYYAKLEEAECAYSYNISKKKEIIRNRGMLLKSLYELAFEGNCSLEAELYKKHIDTILYTYKKFDY